MVYPVLEFREEKQTFAKVERGNVDFFLPEEMYGAPIPRRPSDKKAANLHDMPNIRPGNTPMLAKTQQARLSSDISLRR